MSTVKEVISALNRIDWNFPRSGSPAGTVHALHRFPGNFIAQIPSFLIQVLSKPDDLVFDAFAGSGTTAIEALNLGRRVIAADRVAVCVYLTAAKLTTLCSSFGQQVTSELLRMLTWDQVCVSDAFGHKAEGSDARLGQWYAPRTLAELRYLWGLIETVPDAIRPALVMLFSEVLFACASTARSETATGRIRRHHWGWVADNVVPKRPIEHNAIEAFRSHLFSFSRLLLTETSAQPRLIVIQHDARQMALASASVDLVVTSPPYIGVIDYTRANRLLYLWMGWPFDEDRGQEIGARYKRGRVRFVDEYESEIQACWREIHRVLRDGAYCALVIGESKRFRGTVSRVLNGLRHLMPVVWGPVARFPQRRRVSDRLASQPVEYICVFRKT